MSVSIDAISPTVPAADKKFTTGPVLRKNGGIVWLDALLGSVRGNDSASVEQRAPHLDSVSLVPEVHDSQISGPACEADPLDFVTTTLDDAVNRINNEYFFRRDTSEICRQTAFSGEIQVVSPQQLKTALAGRWVEAENPKTGKMGKRDAATVWLESRERREVFGVQYCPNNVGLRAGHLNLWLGWGVEPVPGDCSIVLNHIHQVIVGGDDRKAEFVLDWCADIFQNPTRKPGVAVVFRGKEGTGKTVPGMILRRLLGARNVLVNSDKDRLLGKFNTALAGKILIQAEETFFAGDARTADALKHLITGQTLEIEVKFGRSFEIDSFHRLLMTSNHTQVIQASSETRRFVVCDVSDARRADADYFGRLYAVADGSDDATARAFMHHLLGRDLSKFKPWSAQQEFLGDNALVDQKMMSEPPRVDRRLQLLRRWSHDEQNDKQILSRGPHSCGATGSRSRRRAQFALGGGNIDRGEDRLHGADAARMGEEG